MKKEDLNIGNVVELKNGKLCLLTPQNNGNEIQFRNINSAEWETSLHKFDDNLIHAYNDNYSIVRVYKDHTLNELLWAREDKEFLNNEEREWLKAIIKPFRDKVTSIIKCDGVNSGYIEIDLDNSNSCMLTPCTDVMDLKFENLRMGKQYSLEELGL